MNRLKLRKKLAVFISLVLVIQMVVGNVAFAEGEDGGTTTTTPTTTPTVKVRVANLMKDKNNTRGRVSYQIKKNEIDATYGSLNEIDFSNVKPSSDENNSNTWHELTLNIDGLSVGDEVKLTFNANNGCEVDTTRLSTNSNGTDVTVDNTTVTINITSNKEYSIDGGFSDINYGGGGTQGGGNTEVGFTNAKSINGNEITYNVDGTDVKVTVAGASVTEKKVLVSNDDFSKVTFKLDGNYNPQTMEVIVQARDGFNTKLSVNNSVTSLANKTNGEGGLPDTLEFIVRKQGTTTEPGGSTNSAPLGLKIGETEVIANGELKGSVSGLKIEGNNSNFKISIEGSKADGKYIVDDKHGEMALLTLGAFVFTGNGKVDINIANEKEGSDLIPDCIANIGTNTAGYSIYDTDGVELDIGGNWDSELYLEGGVHCAKNLVVRDMSKVFIGKKCSATENQRTVVDTNKGIIEGVSDKDVNIDMRTNIEMTSTNGVALKNINYFKATDGGNVVIKSSYTGAIVNNVNRVYIGYGGCIDLKADNGSIGIESPTTDNRSVLYGYYEGDKVSSENQSFVVVDDDMVEEACVIGDDSTKLYKLLYTDKSFELSSRRNKLIPIGWHIISKEDYGEKFTEGDVEKTKDLKYYQSQNNRDDLVINGKYNVQVAKGIIRKHKVYSEDPNNVTTVDEYYFEKGTTIKFELVPDPGYEYDPGTFSFNGGNGTGAASKNKEEVGIYYYTMGDRPVGVSCAFKKADNTVSGNSSIKDSSSVENTCNVNGTLALEINDNDNKIGEMATHLEDNSYTVASALDLSLTQEINKIEKAEDDTDAKWSTPLTDLGNENVTITLGLDDELQDKDEYTIIREHETSNGTLEYETISPKNIDKENKTITFETNKFSTYAIAYKENGGQTPTPKPTVEPTKEPTPTSTPTATPEPTVEPTSIPEPTATLAPTTPTMAPVSEEVSNSVNKEVNTVVEEITKGNDTTVVDSTTAEKIKEAVEQGKEIVTEIVTDTVKQEEVSKTEVQKIANEIKQMVVANTTTIKQSIVNVAQYINLEIVLKAGEEKLGNLTQLKEPVEFTIAVPEKLKVKNRKFFVIRVHNGVVEILDTVTNKDGTLSFKTDRFSTYALAYEDEVAKPAVVKKVKLATRGTNSLKISWDKVTGATGYRVYVVKDGKWTRVDETKINTYLYKNLLSGKSYKFAVKPYKVANGKTIWANTYTSLTTCTKPALVKSIKATTSKRTYVTTTWSKVAGASSYRVYIVKGGKWVKLGTTKYNKFTFKGLKKNTKYKIAVRPVKLDGKTEVLAYTYTASYIKTKK